MTKHVFYHPYLGTIMQGGEETWFNFFLTTQLQLNISLFKMSIQYINYCQELLLAPFTVIAPQYKCI